MVEVMIAFLVLVPIGLVSVDLVAFISSAQQNEQIAEMAARAAATQVNEQKARDAAQDALGHFHTTGVISSFALDDVKFDLGAGTVYVSILMDLRMPVPFPGFSTMTCHASSLQPIVSTPTPD